MSETEDDLTQVLVKAGEILQTLSPPTFISLFFIADDEGYTQTEIAEKIGRTRPTVSKYLRSLKDLPIPLATNPGQHYTVTKKGERVVDFIYRMFEHLGTDLDTIDWSDDEDREHVASFFSPLHNSRSTLPFFILYSIGVRNAIGDRITRDNSSIPVQMWDVISDVEVRQKKRDKSVSVKQVRQTLWRFEDAGTIKFDGEQIELEKKGHEQAFLLEQLIQMLKEQRDADVDRGLDENTSDSIDLPGSDNLAGQDNPRGFSDSGRASFTGTQKSSHESPTIIPTYCFRPVVEDGNTFTEDEMTGEESDSQPPPTPVLPLTVLTLEELGDQVDKLIDEYNGDMVIQPYWSLQTNTGQYPLAPAQLVLNDAYRHAWDIINDAQELWNRRAGETSSTDDY